MADNPQTLIEESAGEVRLALIASSFLRLTGQRLVDSGESLWNAEAVILAHDTQAPPLFIYANKVGLTLFAMAPEQLIGLPSYKSAEADLREERAEMLAKLERENIIRDYSGIRIAADGTRFAISNAAVWNLVDEAGVKHGQAATFSDWEMV